MITSNIPEIIKILEQVADELIVPDGNVLWSPYENQAEALADVKNHIERLKQNDFSKLKALELLFAPTGSLQEISISSGWGSRFLVLAAQFDQAIKGEA